MVTHYKFIQTKLNPYNDFQIKKASYANINCLYIQRSDKSKSIIQRSQIHLEVLKQSKQATQTLIYFLTMWKTTKVLTSLLQPPYIRTLTMTISISRIL